MRGLFNRRKQDETYRVAKPFYEDEEARLPWKLIAIGGALVGLALAILVIVIVVLLQDDDESPAIPEASAAAPTATAFVIGETPTAPTAEPAVAAELPTATVTVLAVNVASPTHTLTFTFVPPTPLPPTVTPSPTDTLTLTATPTVTFTSTPTLTITPIPTTPPFTLPPTSVPPTPTPAGPTIAFPDGHMIRLFYDEYSFYLWNPAAPQIALRSLAFEGLDSTGVFNGKRFAGSTWAQFYEFVEPQKCAALETTQAPALLRPPQCTFYNAIVTPQRTSRFVFWISADNASAFRVLWNEQEIGRCPTGIAECTLYLP